MQIKETPDVSFPGAVESPLLEDVVLADSAGVSLGVQRAFSARVRSVHDDSSGVIASRCVEIPLVGRDGEISGVLCRTAPRSDTRGVLSSRGPEGVRTIGDVAQFVVYDINNLLGVIDSGLRLLECQSDAAYRKAIVSKMRHAITRGALLSCQLLDAARPCPESIGGFVAGSRLAALAGTLDQALIQIGENFYGPRDLHTALQRKASDLVMPDFMRIGGVTGWLRASAIAGAAGIPMSTHLYPEVAAHVMRVTETAHWLEWQDWADPVLQRPYEIRDGLLHIPDAPGVGLEWNEEAVAASQANL
jgi:Enolase C-terminal domain-like